MGNWGLSWEKRIKKEKERNSKRGGERKIREGDRLSFDYGVGWRIGRC